MIRENRKNGEFGGSKGSKGWDKNKNKSKNGKNEEKRKNGMGVDKNKRSRIDLKGFDLSPEVLRSAEKGISYDLYKSLLLAYGKRGEKAFNYLKEDRVKKYLDFFVIVGEEEYVVEDEFCTCNDFQINLKGRAPCAHILALKLSKLLGHYKEFDLYYIDYMDLDRRK